jgi:hypothetical protein
LPGMCRCSSPLTHRATRSAPRRHAEHRQQWQQGTPADWALESLAIVRAQVIGYMHQARSMRVIPNRTSCDSDSLGAGEIPVGVRTKSYLTMTYLLLAFRRCRPRIGRWFSDCPVYGAKQD